MTNQKYTRRTESQWQSIFEQFAASGQTQQAYCAEHGIAVATFSARRTQLQSASQPKLSPAFVEVNVEPPVDTHHVAIYLGDDVRIQCPPTMTVEHVAQLAKSLHHD